MRYMKLAIIVTLMIAKTAAKVQNPTSHIDTVFNISIIVLSKVYKKWHPGLDQGGSNPPRVPVPSALGCGDSGHFLETIPTESQEEGVAAATKPVLRGLKDSATLKVLVLYLYGEVHHGVNHVLKLVGTSHLTGLVHLADDDSIAVMLLAVICNHGQSAFGALAVRMTVLVEPIIHALEAINDEEEGLTRIGLTETVCILQQRGDISFLAGNESVTELEAFADQLDLEEALFGGIKNDRSAGLGELVSQDQHHRGLTGSRFTRKEGNR